LDLGAYDGIIGHLKLELHRANVHFHEKRLECMDDEELDRSIQGEKININHVGEAQCVERI